MKTTSKQRAEVLARLTKLRFTFAEAEALRRVAMTLRRWSEAECNGEIERNEKTGKYERVSGAYISGATSKRTAWPVADREAGALKRLAAIMKPYGRRLVAYHQGDPRGAALYVVTRSQLPKDFFTVVEKADGWTIARGGSEYAGRSKNKAGAKRRAFDETLSSFYSRGAAVY